MTSDARVRVVEHSFGLFDGYEIPIHTADWSTGLIVAMSTGALIYTGISHGCVAVTVDLRDTPPEDIDTGGWDDIVEASVHAPHGHLKVHLLEYALGEQPPGLPLLSAHGSGSYRLRAHARGRDRHFDEAHDDPGEEYLLTLWPAEPLAGLIIRATDRCGYGLRLAQLRSPSAITVPKLGPSPKVTSDDSDLRAAQLRQAILDQKARASALKPPGQSS